MKSMAYEASKKGSLSIQKANGALKKAAAHVQVLKDEKKAAEKEIIMAENACSPGQKGQVPEKPTEKEEQAKEIMAAKVINLRAIITTEVCPDKCRADFDAYDDFKSDEDRKTWLKKCLDACNLKPNIIDEQYASWDTVEDGISSGKIVYGAEERNKILLDDRTVKMNVECSGTTDKSICFDQAGHTVAVAVRKG